jgi:hypothetical protein
MASKKDLILRSAPGVNPGARLEGRTTLIPRSDRSDAAAARWFDALVAGLALLAICLTAWGANAQSPGNFSTLSTNGTATLNGDVLMCSGHPWLDVHCPSNAGGAVGDGSHDDTTAIQAAINTAVASNWPVHIPAGTYKITAGSRSITPARAATGFA